MSIIYDLHTVQDRKAPYEDLKGLINGLTKPGLVTGDFNTIMSADDRINGSTVKDRVVKDFKEFVQDTGLVSLKTVGTEYVKTREQLVDLFTKGVEWNLS